MVSKQKDIERFYLEEFFKILGITPKSIKPFEAPDFIVNIKDKKIGVEVTEYHSNLKGEKNVPRRAVEEEWISLQKQIMGEIDNRVELKNKLGIVYFKKLELPRKSEYNIFIKELTEFSIHAVKFGLEEVKPDSNHPTLEKYLKKLIVKDVDCYISWDWNYNASFIGLTESDLLRVVKSKVVNYKDSEMVNLWLLIACGHRLSQTMPLRIDHKLKSFAQLDSVLQNSKYDNVYILQYVFGVIYEWPAWRKIGKEKLTPTIYS